MVVAFTQAKIPTDNCPLQPISSFGNLALNKVCLAAFNSRKYFIWMNLKGNVAVNNIVRTK